jgi:hypothetical protein
MPCMAIYRSEAALEAAPPTAERARNAPVPLTDCAKGRAVKRRGQDQRGVNFPEELLTFPLPDVDIVVVAHE